MPEYLAPGVYVEEVSFRSKSIEGVATGTTGFAGMARYGPVDYTDGPSTCEPRLITSFTEFERVYGGLEPLQIAGEDRIPYLAHAVKAFFDNGGKRLYVSRVFVPRNPMGRARTASSDPEWKYVNVRRLFNFVEHSIDKGTQWAVFEPNNRRLWDNIRRTIEDFLLNLWKDGALLGDTPEQAFFVRCDRTTMTRNDLDNGRLICLIGMAPVKPAEFVIFRIGQWTADAAVA